jgi:hypothetical protein
LAAFRDQFGVSDHRSVACFVLAHAEKRMAVAKKVDVNRSRVQRHNRIRRRALEAYGIGCLTAYFFNPRYVARHLCEAKRFMIRNVNASAVGLVPLPPVWKTLSKALDISQ